MCTVYPYVIRRPSYEVYTQTIPSTPWQVSCSNGHQLTPYYLYTANRFSFQLHRHQCSDCKHSLSKPQNPFICRICNYLLCIECYQIQYNDLKNSGHGVISYKCDTYHVPFRGRGRYRLNPLRLRCFCNVHAEYKRPDVRYPFFQQYQNNKRIADKIHRNSPWLCDSKIKEYLSIISKLDIEMDSNYKYIRLLIKILRDILDQYFVYGVQRDFRKINCDKLMKKLDDKDKYKWSIELLLNLGWKFEKKKRKDDGHKFDNFPIRLEFDKTRVWGYCYSLIQFSYHELRSMIGENYKISDWDQKWKEQLLYDPLRVVIRWYCMENDKLGIDVLQLIYMYCDVGKWCLHQIPSTQRSSMMHNTEYNYILVRTDAESFIFVFQL